MSLPVLVAPTGNVTTQPHAPESDLSLGSSSADDGDDGDDDDDDEDDSSPGMVSSSGGAPGGGASSRDVVVDDSESAVQLLADSEDDARSSSEEDEDEQEDEEKLSEKEKKKKARKIQKRRRQLMEARLGRDAKRFEDFFKELAQPWQPLFQHMEEMKNTSSNNTTILTLNEYVAAPQPAAGPSAAFVPLFFCPAGKAALSTIFSQFLQTQYSLPVVADICSPELMPAVSHVLHGKPVGIMRIYGNVQEKEIQKKKANGKSKEKPKEPEKKTKGKKGKAQAEEKESDAAAPGAAAESKTAAADSPPPLIPEPAPTQAPAPLSTSTLTPVLAAPASSSPAVPVKTPTPDISTRLCPRLFVLTSDIPMRVIASNFDGSIPTFHAHLFALLRRFCQRFGVTHIFFLHSLPLAVTLEMSESMSKKKVERMIEKATEVGAEVEGEEEEEEGHIQGEQVDGKGLGRLSPIAHSSAVGSGGDDKHGARKPASKGPGAPAVARTGSLHHVKASSSLAADEDEEADDPEDVQEERAQRAFQQRLLDSFLYLSSSADDARTFHKLGGRLLSHALLAGPVSIFLQEARKIQIQPKPADAIVNGFGIAPLKVALLVAYFNPLLSDVRSVFKLAATINQLAEQLTSEKKFYLDVQALRRRAGRIAKKIKKALMKSISETAAAAQGKQPSMYL